MVSLEGSFASPSAATKSAKELRELAQGVVNLTRTGNETAETGQIPTISSTEILAGFRGISLGGGYILTVAHGVINTSESNFLWIINRSHSDVTQPSHIRIGYLGGPHKTTDVAAFYFDSHTGKWVYNGQYQVQTQQTSDASTITVLPGMDAALLYVTSPGVQGEPPNFRYRSAETLRKGEKVYALVARQDGKPPERQLPLLYPSLADVTVLEGIVADHLPEGLSISGRFLTSMVSVHGDSGSPVFDSSGNLIGIVSGDVTIVSDSVKIGTNEYSAITSIDSLLPLIRAERQQLMCPK